MLLKERAQKRIDCGTERSPEDLHKRTASVSKKRKECKEPEAVALPLTDSCCRMTPKQDRSCQDFRATTWPRRHALTSQIEWPELASFHRDWQLPSHQHQTKKLNHILSIFYSIADFIIFSQLLLSNEYIVLADFVKFLRIQINNVSSYICLIMQQC